jgi:penicillin-binding protein 1C
LSQGSAWIIRRILANEAQPLPDNALPQVAPLAWKTGTSYGYRDAWAIGLNARYVIGIWTGRPDGTPVAGQFGFASAVPLLNQVNNLLQSRSTVDEARLPRDPRPEASGGALSAGRAASRCRKAVKTVGVACRPGCWMAANRPRCCCRNRKAFAASVSRSGWIKRVSAWRQIARMQLKKSWMSGRCRWNRGCRQPSVARYGSRLICHLSAAVAGCTCATHPDRRA